MYYTMLDKSSHLLVTSETLDKSERVLLYTQLGSLQKPRQDHHHDNHTDHDHRHDNHIQGVFLTGTPKRSKYRKVNPG